MSLHVEYPFILGTAGHIDHGKTTLVRRLTGINCDRLSEEKKRGITIELGFAPLSLKNGTTVSVIDVPGHEKFIRQMVAGAAGIDAVLLVVAADEGVMPQTREHMDILHLLGVENAIVAVTKKDIADAEFLEIVTDDIKTLLEKTIFKEAPIISVSSLSGEGMDELEQALIDLVKTTRVKNKDGAFFLPIDRVFHVSGFGCIVTGTAYRGTLQVEDEVDLLPLGDRSRVRSIQVHGNAVAQGIAGQRMAVNLPDVSLESVSRGNVLCASGSYQPTSCIDTKLSLLASEKEPLTHWQRVRIHVGASESIGRVVLIDRQKLMPGEVSFVQIVTEEPLVVSYGERFIIRSYSPLKTIAGGVILYPYATKVSGKKSRDQKSHFLEQIDTVLHSSDRLLLIIDALQMITVGELFQESQFDKKSFEQKLASLESKREIMILRSGERTVLSLKKTKELWSVAQKCLEEFHQLHPELVGATVEDLSATLPSFELKALREFLTGVCTLGWADKEGEHFSLPAFKPTNESEFSTLADSCAQLVLGSRYHLIHTVQLAEMANISEEDASRIIHYLRAQKRWKLIGDGFLISEQLEKEFYQLLLQNQDNLTVGVLRDLTASSRKHILALLEYFDSRGITRRVGEKRVLVKKNIDI